MSKNNPVPIEGFMAPTICNTEGCEPLPKEGCFLESSFPNYETVLNEDGDDYGTGLFFDHEVVLAVERQENDKDNSPYNTIFTDGEVKNHEHFDDICDQSTVIEAVAGEFSSDRGKDPGAKLKSMLIDAYSCPMVPTNALTDYKTIAVIEARH